MGMRRKVTTGAGGVYDLGYHVVWCAKYRRPVLAGDIGAGCDRLIGVRAQDLHPGTPGTTSRRRNSRQGSRSRPTSKLGGSCKWSAGQAN
jgi:hypothetical protein